MKKNLLLTGDKFNKLTVLELEGSKNGRLYYKVKCDCGNILSISGSHLRRKKATNSCGCIRKNSKFDSIQGKIFGNLTAIERVQQESGVLWKFLCSCGKEKIMQPYSVINGDVVSCGCYNINKSIGSNNKRWVGGIVKTKNGYIKERVAPGKYKFQHRLVMENFLGRKLYTGETVHHINGNKTDNRIENLELWVSNHPRGQRVQDLIEWAELILTRYKK